MHLIVDQESAGSSPVILADGAMAEMDYCTCLENRSDQLRLGTVGSNPTRSALIMGT